MKFNFFTVILLLLVAGVNYSQNDLLVIHSKSESSTPIAEAKHINEKPANPFYKFIGEWTLKGDDWSQNWGNGNEKIKIPKHHTVCKAINTDNSLLAIIDGAPPHGHIFWTYNPVKKEVNHLSSFGTERIGVGKGSINENGDLKLKVSFEGEPAGTYRIYTYIWKSDNEYELMSIQYNSADQPTGNFYGGTFIRIETKK